MASQVADLLLTLLGAAGEQEEIMGSDSANQTVPYPELFGLPVCRNLKVVEQGATRTRSENFGFLHTGGANGTN